jgi:hypothetical protein
MRQPSTGAGRELHIRASAGPAAGVACHGFVISMQTIDFKEIFHA